jgi:hypothetical protein
MECSKKHARKCKRYFFLSFRKTEKGSWKFDCGGCRLYLATHTVHCVIIIPLKLFKLLQIQIFLYNSIPVGVKSQFSIFLNVQRAIIKKFEIFLLIANDVNLNPSSAKLGSLIRVYFIPSLHFLQRVKKTVKSHNRQEARKRTRLGFNI